MELLDSLEEHPETDSLASLEEKIVRAVELVTRLRQEKEAAFAERDAALEKAARVQAQLDILSGELQSLRAERKQVRTRIEKLLGQINQLSGA